MNHQTFTEAEWPSWHIPSTAPPILTINGHNIQEVFSMINTQLESLRHTLTQQTITLQDTLKREEQQKEKHSIQITKLNSRIDGLLHKINEGNVGKLENRLNFAENKILILEKQIEMEKDSAIKSMLINQSEVSSDHTTRLDHLERSIEGVKDRAVNGQRVDECESKIIGLLSARSDLHSRVVHLEDGQAWFSNEAKTMNENYADLLKNHDFSMNEIKELQSEVYEVHQPDIKKLFSEKMDNSDELKNILNEHHERADSNKDMLMNLETLLGELDRRVMLLGSECRDDLDKMKHRTDKKIDFLHKWIVKYVGTALRDETNTAETDIGTMRCLVCNHPSKKMDTDTPYVNPDFRNTLGYFHDENLEESRRKQGSPSRDPKYRTDSPPRLRAQQSLPQPLHQQDGTKSSSKFAKMRSVPKNSTDYSDQYPNEFPDHVDVSDDRYSGPRTISDPKTVAFYNDMTRFILILFEHIIYYTLSQNVTLHVPIAVMLVLTSCAIFANVAFQQTVQSGSP
jgi:hypothetical protein